MSEAPSVSGISPSEGPLGTKITIRGQNLGESAQDLESVIVCDISCTKTTKWINSGKLIITLISNKIKETTKGEVIITTKSGGKGNSTLTFCITFSKLKPLMNSSVWIEEEYEGIVPGYSEVVEDDVKQIKYESDPLGILSTNTFSSGNPILNENLIQYSSKLSDNNFNPVKFLIDRHSDTNWESIKNGYKFLEKSLNVVHGTANTSANNYLLGNSNVVVNVISDMHKMTTIVREGQNRNPVNIVSSIKNQIEKLNTKILSNFGPLINEHGKTQTLVEFLKPVNKYYTILIIPKTLTTCIKNNGNYINAFACCSKLRTSSMQLSDTRLNGFIEILDTYSNKFISQVIQNLSKVYPIYFSGLLELLKSLDTLKRDEEDYIITVLRNHQIWVNEKCTSVMNAYSSLVKKNFFYYETFTLDNPHLISLIKTSVSFIEDFCIFFSREYNFSMNIIEWKAAFYRSSLKSKKKKSETLMSLSYINEILVSLCESYFTTLTALLLHPFTVLCLSDSSLQENFNPITSLPLSELPKIIQSLTLVTNVVNASSIHLMLEHSSISDLNISFKFTYINVYFSKYILLCREMTDTLKSHTQLCITNTLSQICEDEYHEQSIKCQYDYKALIIFQIIYNWISKFLIIIDKSLIYKANDGSSFIDTVEISHYCSLDSLLPIFSNFIQNFKKSQSIIDIGKNMLTYIFLKRITENLEIKLNQLSKITEMWTNCATIRQSYTASIKPFVDSLETMNMEILKWIIPYYTKQLKESFMNCFNSISLPYSLKSTKQLFHKLVYISLSIKKLCLNYPYNLYVIIIRMILPQLYLSINENIQKELDVNTARILHMNISYIDALFSTFNKEDDEFKFKTLLTSIKNHIKDRSVMDELILSSKNNHLKWAKLIEPSILD